MPQTPKRKKKREQLFYFFFVFFSKLYSLCRAFVSLSLARREHASKSSALHYAVRRNDVQFIEALTKFSPNLEVLDGAGRTALVIAAQENFNECFKVLLKAGSDINAKLPYHPHDPLCTYFSRKGLVKNLALCLEYGAKDVLNANGERCAIYFDLASSCSFCPARPRRCV